VLDALADRADEGMTVFELRSRVDVDIDRLEDALSELKTDGLIEAEEDGNRTVIMPDEEAVGTPDPDDDRGLVDEIRRRLPF
jgi:DNA-binding transcriptional ArsR family regulator